MPQILAEPKESLKLAIPIREDNRVCFFGRVGSGKTSLARAFLRGVSKFAVLDPKHTFRMGQVPTTKTYQARLPRQIIRPDVEIEHDKWEHSIRAVYNRKNTLLYVDELTLVNERYGFRLSPELGRAIRTGRERNNGVWVGSQRPKDIPSAVFTESEHFFIFQLTWDDDRKKVVSFTNSRIAPLLESLKGHEFVYYNVIKNTYFKGQLDEKSASNRY